MQKDVEDAKAESLDLKDIRSNFSIPSKLDITAIRYY